MSSFSSASTSSWDTNQPILEIVVEAWQNQRYKHIIRDWTIGEEPLFSDISGSVEVQSESGTEDDSSTGTSIKAAPESKKCLYSSKAIPIATLPDGWEWSSNWRVDFNDTFGKKDPDGWSYSNSFDSLIKNTMFRSLDSKVERSSVFRRRRWIRQCICNSSAARDLFMSQRLILDRINTKISEAVSNTERDAQQLLEYNEVRKSKINEVLVDTDSSLQETVVCLKTILFKLTQLKSYLVERSAIDQAYSAQLRRLSDKWITAGRSSAPATTDRQSLSSLSNNNGDNRALSQATKSTSTITSESTTTITPNETNDLNSNENISFFDIVCSVSTSFSSRLEDFSSLLSTGMYNDVNGIISELESVLSDCEVGEASTLRRNLDSSLTYVDLNFSLCHNLLKQSRAFNMAQKQFASQNFYNKCASEDLNVIIEDSDESFSFMPYVDILKSNYVYLIRDILENISSIKSKESSTSESSSLMSRLSLKRSEVNANPNLKIEDKTDFPNKEVYLADSDLILHSNIPYIFGYDIWAAMQSFRQKVVESEANFFVYQAFMFQQSKYASEIMIKVSDLLQAALKVFAEQHILIWQDAKELFSSILSDSRFRSNSINSNSSDSNISSPSSSPLASPSKIFKQAVDDLSTSYTSLNSIDASITSEQEEANNWMTSSLLDKINVSQYILKSSKVKFSLFRSSDAAKRNNNTVESKTSRSSYGGMRRNSSGAMLNITEYEIPKVSPQPNSESIDSDPHAWQDGVMLLTIDGMLHILHASSDLGGSTVFDIVKNCALWTAHAPLISCHITKLSVEPSLALFPGLSGDALIIRFSSIVDNEQFRIAGNSGVSNNAIFMSSFIKSGCPLGVVVESSEEVKSWIRGIFNPFSL